MAAKSGNLVGILHQNVARTALALSRQYFAAVSYTHLSGPFSDFVISCDYGTVNPTSFGLWGKQGSAWYRLEEYYYNSRLTGIQRTDEEHYEGLRQLAGNRPISLSLIHISPDPNPSCTPKPEV